MSKDSLILGEAIRKHRRNQGLTMKQLADRTGIDLRTLTNIETGHGNPTFDVLFRLARILDIDVMEIFNPEAYYPNRNKFQLQNLIQTCSEAEADKLFLIMQSILHAIRD